MKYLIIIIYIWIFDLKCNCRAGSDGHYKCNHTDNSVHVASALVAAGRCSCIFHRTVNSCCGLRQLLLPLLRSVPGGAQVQTRHFYEDTSASNVDRRWLSFHLHDRASSSSTGKSGSLRNLFENENIELIRF